MSVTLNIPTNKLNGSYSILLPFSDGAVVGIMAVR